MPQNHVLAKAFVAFKARGGATTERNPSHHPRTLTDTQIYEPLVSLIDPQRVQTNTCWEQELQTFKSHTTFSPDHERAARKSNRRRL